MSRNYGGIRDRAAENERIRKARGRPPPIAVAYRCPLCAGPHRAAECGLTDDVREQLRTLDAGGLQRLRLAALDELAHALIGGAEPEHLQRVSTLIIRIAARMQADA